MNANDELKNKIKSIVEQYIANSKISVSHAENNTLLVIECYSDNKINDDTKTKIQNEIEDLVKNIKIMYLVKNSSNNDFEKLEEKKPENKNCKDKKEKNQIPAVTKIILVASGKGGVGKSTIAGNVAIALAELGWRVGLLDADIYGASIPTIFNVENHEVELNSQVMMVPLERNGIVINSIEFITKKHEALIWRGPMVSKVLEQLMKNTAWGELDYLIIDTPPGTGDIHLTLLENYQIDGFILVSTPHQTSINNTAKTIKMFEKFNIPNVMSIINMSWIDNNLSEKKYLFEKGNLDIINNGGKIIEIPFMSNNSSLFVLNDNHKKFFLEIARNVVAN